MTNHNIDISCSSGNPAPVKVKKGDTVTFINKTNADVEVKFKPGSVFKPSKAKINLTSPGSKPLEISKNKKKATYSWDCPGKSDLTTRNGTIDPS